MPFNRDQARLEDLKKAPLCIVCGRDSEARLIAKILGLKSFGRVARVNESFEFYTGKIEIKVHRVSCYVTSSLDQGIQSFSTSVTALFSILKPKYAIHAGTCAGYKKGIKYVVQGV